MPYTIEFLEDATRDWLSLDSSIRKKLKSAVERLKTNPQDYGKPLSGPLAGLRRIRHRDYRIVYRIEENTKTVAIGVVCHREDVYKIALKRNLV